MIDPIKTLSDLIQVLFTTSGIHGYPRQKALGDIGSSLAVEKTEHLILDLLRAPTEMTGNPSKGEIALLMLYELFWFGWEPIQDYLGEQRNEMLEALRKLVLRGNVTPRQLLTAASIAPALLRNFQFKDELKFSFLDALDRSQINTDSDAADLREECRGLIKGRL